MRLNLPGRVTLFGLALVAVLLLTGWRAVRAWQEADRLRASLLAGEQESFALADHYRAAVLEMNDALVRFGLSGAGADQEEFEARREELAGWLERQEGSLRRPASRALLRDIRGAFTNYLVDADSLRANRGQAGISPGPMLEKVEADSRQLLQFSRRLDVISRAALASFLLETDEAVSRLHASTLGAVALVLVLATLLAVFVWRDLIAPLRRRLVASHEQLERREKLSSLGVLAAGVAHEIRNPLTSIKARAFTLKRLLRSGSPEAEDAAVIGQEIGRLERVVNEFLAFSRPPEPRLAAVRSAGLLADLERLAGPEVAERGARLRVEVEHDAGFTADPGQLRQVLHNLVRNAVEATGPGGSVRVRAGHGEARLGPRPVPVVVFEVIDDGPGIPAPVQKRLFDPFFTTKAGGTGLGLSTAARMVERHGGVLRYQTGPGRGTVFSVLLPLGEPEEFPGLRLAVAEPVPSR